MATALIKAEIRRFLESTTPEVLCIKGKWGVGKTYAWQQYLNEIAEKQKLGLKKYSYVSLFGLNSLDALRFAIFESTIPEKLIGRGPNVDSLRDALQSAGAIGRSAKSWAAPLLSLAGMSGTEEALARATFFSVRNQIMCIDDLERSGSNLELRDVLGLASMLKEQRRCKIVFLLNDQQLQVDEKEEFEKLLEKVVDVSLVFEPSPNEAVEIAFQDKTHVNCILSDKVTKICITNIRVIKKIERLADRLADLLGDFRNEVIESAMSTVTIAGWSVFQPDAGPPVAFLKRFNRDVESVRSQNEGPEENRRWAETLASLGYQRSDNLDVAIIEGAAAGYYDEEQLLAAAKEIQTQIENDQWNNSFSKAWERYHHSLNDDDDTILNGLFEGALENLNLINPTSLNATVRLLRELGREKQATQLAEAYMAVRKFGRGAIEDEFRIWGNDPIDPVLETAFKKIDDEYIDSRDPKDVLCKIAESSSWNSEDIELLSKQKPEDYERIFESIHGPDLSRSAKFAIRIGKHDGPHYKAMGDAVGAGLKRIAAKSPLRAKRISSYGVELD